MEKFETALIAVAAVIVGWGLNELSALIRFKQADRAAIGRVLYYLADIRHSLYALTGVFEQLGSMFPISDTDKLTLKTVLESMLPKSDEIHQRFEDVIAALADRQPHLAFRLRNKDSIDKFLKQFRTFVDESEESINAYTQVEKTIMTKALENIDSIILELAWMHGIKSRWKFGKLVNDWNDPDSMKKEIEELFRELFGDEILGFLGDKQQYRGAK